MKIKFIGKKQLFFKIVKKFKKRFKLLKKLKKIDNSQIKQLIEKILLFQI